MKLRNRKMNVDIIETNETHIEPQWDKSIDMSTPQHSTRSLTTAVAVVGCGFAISKFIHYITVGVGILIMLGGGVLGYAGMIATVVQFGYVCWAFAGLMILSGAFVCVRTFTVAAAVRDLEAFRNRLEATNTELTATSDSLSRVNIELKDAAASMQNEIDGLTRVNESLHVTADKLKAAGARADAHAEELANDVVRMGQLRDEMVIDATKLRAENAELGRVADMLKLSNSELAYTVIDLQKSVTGLKSANTEFVKSNSELRSLNADMYRQVGDLRIEVGRAAESNEQLRTHVAALAECNERFRTAIGALVSAGDQAMDMREMIRAALDDIKGLEANMRNERDAQEAFTLRLTGMIFAQMDLDGDGTISADEQSAWLEKLKKNHA